MMKKTFYLLALIVIGACSASKIVVPSQTDADRGKETFPDLTMAQLLDGKTLYMENCGKCHKLFAPESKSIEKWKKYVPPMSKKARIDSQAQDLILKYVVTMSNGKTKVG